MRSRIGTMLLTLGLLVAFAPATHAQTTLRYQFKEGEKFQYVMDQKTKMTWSIMGKDIDTKTTNIMLEMTCTVAKADRGTAQLQIKVTHAKMSVEGPMLNIEVDSKKPIEAGDGNAKPLVPIVKAMAALEMSGAMLPTGEFKDLKLSEESIRALKGLPGADKLADIFSPDQFKTIISKVVFPAEPISKGKTWISKNEVKTPLGKTITENTYSYEGSTEKDGKTLEKISVKPNLKIEPDPALAYEAKIKDLKANATILFDNKAGRMLEATENQKTEMQITHANGGMFTQSMDQTISLQLKKK